MTARDAIAEIRTSPKIARCPNGRSRALRDALVEIVSQYEQATVRQAFYRAVVAGAVEKTEQAYKRVADALVQLRLSGVIPFSKIVDGHRTRRIASSWNGLLEFGEDVRAAYRRDFWTAQPEAVELWCEKDALSGILQPIADEYGLPYVATRGFPSLTLVHESASAIAATGKPTTVLYCGDHDASGRSIDDALRADLQGVGVKVERIALLSGQIKAYALPTRPGKRSDSRHRGFVKRFGSGDSVELDALPPSELEAIVRAEIGARIDRRAWEAQERTERLEKDSLEAFLAKWPT